ncbi:hypothetical protein ATANTOWER_032041 [Ataeniobius toweri]|uniref:Uncharacterized protein n=1 Tax=Ataeniobius toweri TaxID=208326 RepID=A0ABU7AC36_9TELE|nr:hypothetical protein [Ataeniobius toweri]
MSTQAGVLAGPGGLGSWRVCFSPVHALAPGPCPGGLQTIGGLRGLLNWQIAETVSGYRWTSEKVSVCL